MSEQLRSTPTMFVAYLGDGFYRIVPRKRRSALTGGWLPKSPAAATKRPRTDEQGPSGTSGHQHDDEAYKANGGDE